MTRLSGSRRLSISAYGTYLECPKRWDYTYLQRRRVAKKETPEHMRFGNVIHAGMEAAYHAVVQERYAGSLEAMIPVGMQGVRDAWAQYAMPTTGGELDRALGMIQETLASLTDSHENVLGIEHKFIAFTPGGTPFIGFADLIRKGDVPGSIEVRDYKVTKATKSAEELATDMQGNLYAHFALKQWPWATDATFSHLYPNHGPQYVVAEVTAESISESLERFDVVGGMINMAEEFKPRMGDHCSWCDHRDVCPAWNKENPDEQSVVDAMVEF